MHMTTLKMSLTKRLRLNVRFVLFSILFHKVIQATLINAETALEEELADDGGEGEVAQPIADYDVADACKFDVYRDRYITEVDEGKLKVSLIFRADWRIMRQKINGFAESTEEEIVGEKIDTLKYSGTLYSRSCRCVSIVQ